jgi:hypothetical protein
MDRLFGQDIVSNNAWRRCMEKVCGKVCGKSVFLESSGVNVVWGPRWANERQRGREAMIKSEKDISFYGYVTIHDVSVSHFASL